MRLDIAVSTRLSITRSSAAKLIANGCVLVNDNIATKTGLDTKESDNIIINEPVKQQKLINPLIPTIIFEDEHILILNKPAGIVVHEAPNLNETTIVDWLRLNSFSLASNTGDDRAGVVHRLDKDTSGLLAIAKTDIAAISLKEQLQTKTMGRYYMAIVTPALIDDKTVDAPLARHPKNRLKRAVISDGKSAKTAFVPINSNEKASLIGAKLYSGRTHQIRAHLAHINRYILGDSLYGFKTFYIKIPIIALHAGFMRLIHPTLQTQMEFMANPPQEFCNIYKEIFNEEIINASLLPSFFDGLL